MVIANGAIFNNPTSYKPPAWDQDALTGINTTAMISAIDWVYANAGKGDWKHIDKTRIGVWGHSCGGLQAYNASPDERVHHIGIFDSGGRSLNESAGIIPKINKPVFYLLGGPTDEAAVNVSRNPCILTLMYFIPFESKFLGC